MHENELDLLDRKIMYELDLNARSPVTKIAKRVRESKDTVNFRIKRLLREGYLKGFYTVFNTAKLGMYYYKTYIKLHRTTPEIEKQIADFIGNYKTCAYLGSVEGNYDFIFLIAVRNAKDFTDFLGKFGERFGEYVLEKDVHVVTVTHRLNEKFLYAGPTSKHSYYQDRLESVKIDKIDRRILHEVSFNARIPIVELAARIGISPNIAKYRLRRMEKEGVIIGYVSAPNFDRLGLRFIQLNFNLKQREDISPIIQFFDNTRKCLFALELIGKYDLTVEIHVRDEGELRSILDEFKKAFVNRYNRYDILNVYKENVVVWLPYAAE